MAKRIYPHVQGIKDDPTRKTIRLLWDKMFSATEGLNAAQNDLRTANGTIVELQGHVTKLQKQIIQASASSTVTPKNTNFNTTPPNVDDGLGAQGCATNTGTGHVDPSLPLDPVTAGMIVCGTALEWSALVEPAVDQPTRDANQAELLERIIWHLNLAGYTAGRQQNPTGVISGDKITILIEGNLRAYDVFQGAAFDQFIVTHMIQVWPPVQINDGGTPD